MAYLINERCVCCHYCAMECPVEAIRFVGSQYKIDPDKCVSCGVCAEVCPLSSIINSDVPVAPPVPHEMEHLSCDLLVLGAGGAGLIAAVKAAELSGKKVIVMEKGKKVGGSTNLAHGFMVCHCKWFQEQNLEVDIAATIERCLEQAEGKLPRSLVEKTVMHTGYFFDWLCEKGGAEGYFEIGKGILGVSGINFPNRSFENLKCRDQSIGPGWAGTYVVRKMLEQCEKLGIPVLTEHAGVRLLTDDSGAVTGALINNPGGQVEVSCQAVILATGGFSGNDEQLKKFEPNFFDGGIPVHRFSPLTCSGDGIDMAGEIGGWTDMKRTKLNKFGPAHHPFSHSINRLTGPDCKSTFTLDGQLKTDKGPMKMDDTSFMDSIPEHAIWYVLDNSQVERKSARLIANPPDGNEQWIFETYMQDVEFELKCDRPAKRGSTLQELAENMGVDPEKFIRQVEEYNQSCDPNATPVEFDSPMGKMIFDPPQPLKEPPFYAFFGQRFCEGAFGGVLTNNDLEVIRENGEAILGLYAVGDTAGTWFNRGILGPLTELTWAVTSGYMAGCSAGKFIKEL